MKKVLLIDYDLCSPRTCGRNCQKKCPIVLSNAKKKPHQKKDEEPVRYKNSTEKMIIVSEYCIQCGVCINVCPRNAIYSMFILDQPDPEEITHEYSVEEEDITILKSNISQKSNYYDNNQNRAPKEYEDYEEESSDLEHGFRLYGLPTLLPGKVTGLCGPNGIGKSTMLNILSGKLIPNFGEEQEENKKPVLTEIITKFKDNEIRTHFKELYGENRIVAYKQQVLKVLFDAHVGEKVIDILQSKSSVDDEFFEKIVKELDITAIQDRELKQCSGGELQRFAIASVLIEKADCYLIDEPCTFLDVKKRIELAKLLQARAKGDGITEQYPILVVEHDLAILDYLSDNIHLFYGKPHRFGVITRIQNTKKGINAYLNGFIKTENIQFRKTKIGFRRSVGDRVWNNARIFAQYGKVSKTYDSFRLDVDPGTIYEGEILGIVGENGCGKSTFAKILAGIIKPDDESEFKGLDVFVSYKPQYITKNYNGTVKEFIMEYSKNYDFSFPMVQKLYGPLGVDEFFETPVKELSGGQLQRTFICTCLAKRANLYILDEPSAYLDVEERLNISNVIRSMTKNQNATTICIEHDIAIVDALSDRLFLFTGTPGIHGKTIGPLNKREGMNEFLKILDITFRRDFDTGRARINKLDSSIDKRQRAANEYFYSPTK